MAEARDQVSAADRGVETARNLPVVPSEYNGAIEYSNRITDATWSLVRASCVSNAQLCNAVLTLIGTDRTRANVHRLLPFSFADQDDDSLTLVGTISRVWWAGAETFDDLNDNMFDSAMVGLSQTEALLASTACITLLPPAFVERYDLAFELAVNVSRELTSSCLHAANGQLEDLKPDATVRLWPEVTRSYVGKSGAPYGRDLAILALLNGKSSQEVRSWRTFGQMYGLLRQMANDREALATPDNDDFLNGTRTLLLACALEAMTSAEQQDMVSLHTQARRSTDARKVLINKLMATETAAIYDARVAALHLQLSTLLERLLAPSSRREFAQWLITSTAQAATLAGGESTANGP